MSLPVYRLNGTTLHGVQAGWERVEKRTEASGVKVYQPMARHIWEIETVPVASYVAMEAAAGQLLTLETSDFDDPTQGASYSADLVALSAAEQIGLNMTGVRLEFRVGVS